ncbi:MAG: asparagine synthetase B [Candidatus Hydrothermarchaeota archaeon]|nr:MAG: asparagine synthetase B [Candidatus Hydrothermarchaeota archaeon]
MCGICGGYLSREKVEEMLRLLYHRGPDARGIYCSDNLCLAHALLGIVGEGKQPFFGCNKGFVLVCNGRIYNHEELRKKLANHVFSTTSDNEVIIHLIEENFDGDLIKAVEKTLKQLDGDFAFAIAYKGKVAIARDFVGVKPLYFGNKAFASERKALWKINEKAEALLPGEILLFPDLVRKRVKVEYRKKIKNPLEELEKALVNAVEKRTRIEKFGILFSGGVDSFLIAKISQELERSFTLYSVAMRGSHDYKLRNLRFLNMKFREIKEEEIEDYARKVIYAIEEYDRMKVGVGIPTYIACEEAKKDGIGVILSGQGADELFAGYKRYLRSENLSEELKKDFENLYKVNLQRDEAIAMANSIEIRLPYLDSEVISIAFSLPEELKIKGKERKYILNKIARKRGIEIREKKAIQYSTGVEKALRKIAKRRNLSVEEYLRKLYNETFKKTKVANNFS